MNNETKKKLILLVILSLYAYIIILSLFSVGDNPIFYFIRLFALIGLLSMSIAAIMTPFAVELYKLYGKSFIKLHHLFSLTGLIFITLHPVFLAVYSANPFVFLPDFSSWLAFWELAGRPALILIYVAILAALLRKVYQKSWKLVHALVYIALIFGIVHGTLIGTNFSNPLVLVFFYVLFAITIFSFIYKRYKNYQQTKKLAAKKAAQKP